MSLAGRTAADEQRFVDLHMHSTASDGAFGPAEVVSRAHAARLSAIALTDHDTVDGIAEASAAGARLGVTVIAGVELSAVEGAVETHILGLHLANLEVLERRLVELKRGRVARAERIVETLNTLGVPITLSAVLAQAGTGAVGRPHIARALIAARHVGDMREAFDRFLGAGRPAFVQKEAFTAADAVALVHAAGGLAVLAHPGERGVPDHLEALVGVGMDGIEIRHPSHSGEVTARLAQLSERFELLPSGGSDWHGATSGSRVLGCMRVPAEWLERQRRYLDAAPARSGAA